MAGKATKEGFSSPDLPERTGRSTGEATTDSDGRSTDGADRRFVG